MIVRIKVVLIVDYRGSRLLQKYLENLALKILKEAAKHGDHHPSRRSA